MARRPGLRETTFDRRQGSRATKRKVLVVCEGETEFSYFEGLTESDLPDVDVVLRPEKSRKGPQKDRVIAHAREARSKAAYSAVWAVFDADGENVRGLCEEAETAEINTAVSNPTFEVWLILHLRDRGKARTAAELQRELKKLLPQWSKGAGTKFHHFAKGLPDACKRARQYPDYQLPSTQVWRLMADICQSPQSTS